MSCDPAENLAERKVRRFAFIGPLNGVFNLFEAGNELRRFRANAEGTSRFVAGIADQFSDELEALE